MLSNLIKEMGRLGITSEQLAHTIGKDVQTILNKVNGTEELTFFEAVSIHSKFFPTLEMSYLFQEDGDCKATENERRN